MNWYTVRIDKGPPEGSYEFRVTPFASEGGPEMIAIDSVPGVMAIVKAENPALACARAWEKAFQEMQDVKASAESEDERNAVAMVMATVFGHYGKELPQATDAPECPACRGRMVRATINAGADAGVLHCPYCLFFPQ
jgi:hypothetical protein